MTESAVQADIRAEAGRLGIHLFRNNVGACNDDTGRIIRYGLGNDSPQVQKRLKSSDLIGMYTNPVAGPWRTAQFVAVECKKPGWKFPAAWRDTTPETIEALAQVAPMGDANRRTLAQWRFLKLVHDVGGAAGFAQSVEDFHRILKRELVLP